MNSMQAMLNSLSTGWQQKRSESQMTLGKLIEVLEGMEPSTVIEGLGSLDSYRGYYSDLAFDPTDAVPETVEDLLVRCKAAMGQVFQGYKGGDFMMGATTPLFVASYGSCGPRLMSMDPEGTYTLSEEED